ncbi:DNA repair helicase XPB [Marinicrinis sediminis]|uniref:DNA 3'-5' helicase n=1 Tax=Marinicrinis sediminis TaxID=1652465 RepID=A0ABW5R625_9BACL
MSPSNPQPLIVQANGTILLETASDPERVVRTSLHRFADLQKSTDDHLTYVIHSLSLWHAAAQGAQPAELIRLLQTHAKFGVPQHLQEEIRGSMGRYGKVKLEKDEADGKLTPHLKLSAEVETPLDLIREDAELAQYVVQDVHRNELKLQADGRGWLKQRLALKGWPVMDFVGFDEGERLEVAWQSGRACQADVVFQIRDYQKEAIHSFMAHEQLHGGSGVIVLPCGAGKTIVGIGAIEACQCAALILTTNQTSVQQWRRELLEKTTLHPHQVSVYSSEDKQVAPVTIATYQMLTYRRSRDGAFQHLSLFQRRDWGLIIYDEVHLLPAPVFRMTAELQAKRRLGLTATLVREDSRETDVFSLVGPKKYESGWKPLEKAGFIARVDCVEYRVLLGDAEEAYLSASGREQLRMAAVHPSKLEVVRALLKKHQGEQILVMGTYLDQLKRIAHVLQLPLISGQTSQSVREHYYEQFKRGEFQHLCVSKVANFAVDLPAASVAIQVSGSFGSRQEEAQRIGRIMRPKENGQRAMFYTVVTQHTREQAQARHRQLFMLEQGYHYTVKHWEGGDSHARLTAH